MDYPIGSNYIPLNNSTSVHIPDLALPGKEVMRAELWPFSLWYWNWHWDGFHTSAADTQREKTRGKNHEKLHCCLPGHQPGMAPHSSLVHEVAIIITFMLSSRHSFFSFFISNWRFLWSLWSFQAPPRIAVIPECQAATFTVEDATHHSSLLAGVCLLCARLFCCLLPLPESYHETLQMPTYFLNDNCCFHPFTCNTATSHNPTELREELNEACIPIFPFICVLQVRDVHLQACKLAVWQMLSCSLWTGKSLLNSASHCYPL